MKVKRFSATSMQQALKQVREDLGADAVILSSRKLDGQVEVVAALNYDEQEARSRAPDPERPKTSAQLARIEADRHLHLQQELERSRQRIAALRQANEPPAREVAVAAADISRGMQRNAAPVHALSKAGQSGAKRQESGAVATADITTSDALAQMRAEILGLKDLLIKQQQQAQVPVFVRELEERLNRMGLFPELQKKLLGKINADADIHTAWRYVVAQLTRAIKTQDEELIHLGGVVALVGPTGVGKTTTIGKLAARHVLQHGTQSIALVTTDRYRIAAHEQLLAFGRILGIPVRVVDDKHPLDAILDALRDKKLVLIDTAGLNHQDAAWSKQVKELKSSKHRIQNFLVVPAINQSQVMKSTYHCYKMVNLAGCVISKLDEAMTLGEALSLAAVNGLPVAYVTDGQKIPDDIHHARASQLVNRALQALHPSAGQTEVGRLGVSHELVV